MTERDNLLRMLSGEKADHLPLDVWMTEPARDLMESHTGSRDEVEALGLAVERIGPAYTSSPESWIQAYRGLGFMLSPEATVGCLGTVHDCPPAETLGAAYHLREMRHPLEHVETVSQLSELPWPDWESPDAYAHLGEAVEGAHRRGLAAVGQMDCTAFEMAWYLRGMGRLFLDLVDRTGLGDWLLDWFTQRAVHAVGQFVRSGFDIVWLGDDVGTQRGMMMAVPFWREHLKPRLAQVVQAVRDAETSPVWVAYHSDGDVREIIDDLVEVGVDVLNPVQPECMPVVQTVGDHRHHLAFWGMIGTQSTMPFGTPSDVKMAVTELADLARDGARVVLSPTHMIEPDVPWENLSTLVKASHMPLFNQR